MSAGGWEHSDEYTNERLLSRIVTIMLGGVSMPPTVAVATSIQNPATKAHWYPAHDQGTPALSSTITERHIRNGYEVLDQTYN
jgi:hypothetical protein